MAVKNAKSSKKSRHIKSVLLGFKLKAKRRLLKTFGFIVESNKTKNIINGFKKIGNTIGTVVALGFTLLWAVGLRLASKLMVVVNPVKALYAERVSPVLAKIEHKMQTRQRVSRLTLVSGFATVLLVMFGISNYNIAIAVSIDGEFIGYVESEEQIDAVIAEIEKTTSDLLGRPYALNANIQYDIEVKAGVEIISDETARVVLSNNVTEIMTLAVVTVDGEVIGALESATDAEAVIEQIKLERVGGDASAEVEFLQEIKVEVLETSASLAITGDQLKERLNATSQGEHVYEVVSGDTLSGIAADYDMRVSEVMALNPQVEETNMQIGQDIVVSAAVPTLSAKVTREVEYTESIPFDTVTEENDDMAKNTKKVITDGTEGSQVIQAEIVTIDGVETERTIMSTVVLSEPVTEVVEVGTKVIASQGTGDMLMPTSGRMSSNYGYRSSGFHTGVDFANSQGTSIKAADNGRVVFAGWNGGYGNCIIIDHGNGIETLYAHNSSLSVSVGQVVERGQRIASMGSTGNSTGSHLHFEVRINGKHVNPWGYIG